MKRYDRLALLAVACLAGWALAGTPAATVTQAEEARAPGAAAAAASGADETETTVATPPPPFSKGIFPCSQCHEGEEIDTTPRRLSVHKEIVLSHDEANRWCLDCHDAQDRDRLRLASGKLIEFAESYRLCGQCHGPEFRDWRHGAHGKRTGAWSGKKQYLLCAHCHNPHSPQFKPIVPEPPPVRPEEIR
jgi:hypothetical protein